MIRKSGFVMVVVLPVLVAGWLYIARNGLVEGLAELALEKVTGAPVELEGVSVDPFNLSAGFERLRLADPANPSRPLLTTGKARFGLNGPQLFAGKLVVSEMQLEGVEPTPLNLGGNVADAGQARPSENSSTPGGTGQTPSSSQAPSVSDEAPTDPFAMDFDIPKLDLSALYKELDIERLTSDQPLGSEQALSEAEKELDRRMEALDKHLAQADLEARAGRIEQDARKIDFSSKDPKKLKASLDAGKSVGKDVKVIREETRALTREASESRKVVAAAIDKAEQEIKADVAAAMRLANLGDLNTNDIGRLLFGQAVQQQINWVLDKFRLVKSMVNSDKEPQGEPPRRAGRLIAFPVTGRVYPGFLLEKAAFEGRLPILQEGAGDPTSGTLKPDSELTISGSLQGLSSNSAVYGAPTLLSAKASNAKGESWALAGRYDPRQRSGSFRAQASGRKVQLNHLPLGGGPLPRFAQSQNATIDSTVTLMGDQPEGMVRIEAQQAAFFFAPATAAEGPTQAAMRKEIAAIFSSIDWFTVGASITSVNGERKVRISSSLDEQVSRGLKTLLGKRRGEAEARIRRQMEHRLSTRRTAISTRLQERLVPLEQKAKNLESRMATLGEELANKQAQAEKSLKMKASGDLLNKLKKR